MINSWSNNYKHISRHTLIGPSEFIENEEIQRWIYNDECKVAEINQIIDTSKDMDRSNSITPSGKNVLNKTNKNYIYWGTCWKCSEFSHLAKEFNNIPSNANLFDNTIQDQTMINSFRNL